MTVQTIFNFLSSQFAIDPGALTDTTGLFSEGFLDSFSIVDLIQFLESSGNIQIDATEVTLDNLDSAARIATFVESKSAQPR